MNEKALAILRDLLGDLTYLDTGQVEAQAQRTLAELREALGGYEPGPHDRITQDDAVYPEGAAPSDAIDEIVLSGVGVHLEMLDRDHATMNLTADDVAVQVEFHAHKGKRGRLEVYLFDAEGLEKIPKVEVDPR